MNGRWECVEMRPTYCTGTKDPCKNENCQECCEHPEHDHYVCLYCGRQGDISDYGEEDYYKDLQDDR